MLRYAGVRFAGIFVTLFLVYLLSFAIMEMAPGGVMDTGRSFPPEIRATLNQYYGYSLPAHERFFLYLGNMLRGDLGHSFGYSGYSVTALLAKAYAVTLPLAFFALLLASAMAPLLAFTAVASPWKSVDRIIGLICSMLVVLPVYVTAPLLQLLFSMTLHLLPPAGWREGRLADMVMPVISIAMPLAGSLAILLRDSMRRSVQSPYIHSLAILGMGRARLYTRYALRAVLPPIAGWLSPACVSLFTGAFAMEMIFGVPGVGRYFVHSALARDYPVLIGTTMSAAIIVMLANVAADMAMHFLDPHMGKNHGAGKQT